MSVSIFNEICWVAAMQLDHHCAKDWQANNIVIAVAAKSERDGSVLYHKVCKCHLTPPTQKGASGPLSIRKHGMGEGGGGELQITKQLFMKYFK